MSFSMLSLTGPALTNETNEKLIVHFKEGLKKPLNL